MSPPAHAASDTVQAAAPQDGPQRGPADAWSEALPETPGAPTPPPSSGVLRRYVLFVFWLSLLAALLALLSGPANRFGWLHFGTAFSVLRAAAIAGALACLLCIAGALWALKKAQAGYVALCLVGLLAGLITLGLPLQVLLSRGRLPPIHDISTDTSDPPKFIALAAARTSAPNGGEYGGAAVAALQRDGYPDIVPLTLALPPDQALVECLHVAKALGWELAASPTTMRFEATDTTAFFGFKDDIVVRITPAGPASRIDLRSSARAGRGDLGTNASRIREFYRLLSQLQPDDDSPI